jgi:hypothetical protein
VNRTIAAVVVNLLLGAPFYLLAYLCGWFLNFIAYATAWIGGPQKEVAIWFSLDMGPTYASMNVPWAWTYAGTEPEDRLVEGFEHAHHIRQIPIVSLDTEWPPAFAFGRTKVGIRYNKRGDESFPLVDGGK